MLQGRRTGSGSKSLGDSDTPPAGTAWCRKGEAICSIALLCLGGALVIYGVAMMNFGNPTMTESQREQWHRVARIKLYQYQQLEASEEIDAGAPIQYNETELELSRDPHAQHLAAKVKQVFESVISSEELPRKHSQTGSLQEHQQRGNDTRESANIAGSIRDPLLTRKLLYQYLDSG